MPNTAIFTPGAFWTNATVRAILTALLFGLAVSLPGLVTIWQTGSFGHVGDYVSFLAFTLGGVGSYVVSLLTRITGDPNSGTFTH